MRWYRIWNWVARSFTAFISAIVIPSLCLAANQSRDLHGPEQYIRTGGGTTVYNRTFTVPSYVLGPYQLHIVNGAPSGANRVAIEDAVSSGRVILNGVEVVSPSDFSKTTAAIDKTVTLSSSNTLEIRLNSAPDSYITLTISGTINLADLGSARSGHTATLLSDGKILITGGNGVGSLLSSVEVFNPATLTFSAHPNPLTTPRSEHTATLLPNTEALLVAGRDPQGVSFTAELFDPVNGTFTSLSENLENLRSGHTATVLADGRVLIVGGVDGAQASQGSAEAFDPKAVDLFDPTTGTFTSLAHGMSVPRSDHTATLLPDGRILILGGSNSSGILSSGEIFDPATSLFTPIANAMTASRSGHTATLLPDGRVLIAGGKNNSGPLASIETFDPATQTFSSQSQNLLIARWNHTATLLPSGEILIAGGEGNAGPINHTELYGPPAADTTAPTVLLVNPGDAAQKVFLNTIVAIRFSEPIKVTTLTASSLTLTGPNGAVAGIVSPAESGLLAFFVPQAKLSAGASYTIGLNGATDLAGNPLAPFTSTFTTYPAPAISVFSPQQGGPGTTVTISGENFDTDSIGNNKVYFFDGVEATISVATETSLTVTVPAGAANGPITVTTPGGTATSVQNFIVALPPSIASFSPTSGFVGTTVTITGSNFDVTPSNNTLAFNGRRAIITSATRTEITATVPQGATTGPITVTTPQEEAVSAEPFTVTPSFDFTVAAVPATLSLLQGSSAAAILSMTSTGSELFTGLAALSAGGLPAGVTVLFDPPQLAAGQQSVLRISVGAAVPAGNTLLTLTASATIDGQVVTRSTSLMLAVVTGGPTSLTGQVLTVDGDPIPGVELHMGAGIVTTDAAGNFFFGNVPSGTQQMMIDANAARPGFPIYAMDLVLVENQPNLLPPIRLTPPPPPERFTPINNGAASQVITDPRFPGVEITLPAGVTITGWDGLLKTKMAIERLSPDRLPVPPPPGPTRSLYQIFFGTPVGGVPSAPLPVAGPNELDLEPGSKAELWYYNASPMGGPAGWQKAGTGTVSADGSRIVSDPGVGIERFCGVCGLWCWISGQNVQPNLNPDAPQVADPVDFSLGQHIVEKTDFVLPGRYPIQISRTYSPFDPFGTTAGFQPSLGPGWYLSLDVFLLPVNADLWRLILPGNTRIPLARQPDGTFANTGFPSFPFMRGASLSTLSNGDHQLRFKDGTTWRFRSLFLGLSFLVEMADRNGNRVVIERESAGKIVQIADDAGRTFHVTYAGSRISEINDPLGRAVQYGYDANGRLSTVTDPAGGITRYTYNNEGQILTIEDAKGIVFVRNEYGSSGGKGPILRQILADGGEYRFYYKRASGGIIGLGCPGPDCPFPLAEQVSFASPGANTISVGFFVEGTVFDPRGNRTAYRLGPWGYVTELEDALGQVTLFERETNTNLLLSTTDPLGRIVRYAYDQAGNTTSITDPDGNVTRFEYEPSFSRLARLTDPLGQDTIFEYDAKGNLVKTTDPLGNITTLANNPFGQPTSVADPLGNATQFEYDDVGDLTATVDPLGNRRTRFYDTVSRLLSTTDPLGRSTRFTYDLLNRVTKITDAAAGVTEFSYDPNGNLLSVTDSKGQATTYTYDLMDRLASRTDPLTRTESYSYDLNGNLETFTDRKGQVTTFTYDPLNRRREAAFADASKSEYFFDAIGRLVRVNDTDSGAIDLAYDNLNRLVQEMTPQGIVDYGYDPLGRRTSMTANGQTPVGYQYDANSRLTQVAQGTQIVGLGYDAAGRRAALSYPNGTNTGYTYDAASRLTNILHQSGAITIEDLSYSYDAAGNRTRLIRANAPATVLPSPVDATYDAANEQIRFNNGTPNLTYDANGNLVSQTDPGGTTTYTWDARNRLIGISGTGISASFVYDALGRRISKTINGVRADHQYDGNDIIAEIGGSSVSATYLRSLNIDEPFVRESNTSEYYHVDALGSTLALTGGSGATTTSYTYEAFGKTAITGTSGNSFQYTGRENDDTGIYYYRARYYSPRLFRFLSEDPLHLGSVQLLKQASPLFDQLYSLLQRYPELLNHYVYVGNNPLIYTDPDGLFFWPGAAVGAGVGAIGGIAGALAQGGSAGDIVAAAIIGGGTGALAGGFGWSSAAAGAVIGGINDILGQGIGCLGKRKCDFNFSSVIGASLGGALGNRYGNWAGGALAGEWGTAVQSAFGALAGMSPGTVTGLLGNGIGQATGF